MADREITQSPTFPSQAITDHTANHAECPACEFFGAMRILDVSLPFDRAARIWIDNHSSYIGSRSRRVYLQHVKRLSEFFQQLPVGQITIGNIRAYQQWRMAKVKCTEMINAEVATVLAPILAEVGHWEHFQRVYKPLPVKAKITRQAMSEEEERRLMAVALDSSKPRRLIAGHCLIVMCNTGMGFGELRHLRREDVRLDADPRPLVTVNEGLKNAFRQRTVPLNWIAVRSMRWIIKRWEDLGGIEGTQYILPHHARHNAATRQENRFNKRVSPPIFTEPMGHIYKAARAILNEAGLEEFDPYDMRSHFGTKLLSDVNVSDQMFEEIFGHRPDSKTKRLYSRQRIEKKAAIVEKLALDPEPPRKLLVFSGRKK